MTILSVLQEKNLKPRDNVHQGSGELSSTWGRGEGWVLHTKSSGCAVPWPGNNQAAVCFQGEKAHDQVDG